MTNTSKRYFIFSKRSYAKTGVAKPMRRAATRGEARAHKDGDTALGIWDTVRNVAVR
jgi:hypothetical protein